jgi:hypothetical protein
MQMPDPMRPGDLPLRLWLIVTRPGDLVVWVEADRVRDAGSNLELIIDIMFLGRPRPVVEQRLAIESVLLAVPLHDEVPWRPHRW